MLSFVNTNSHVTNSNYDMNKEIIETMAERLSTLKTYHFEHLDFLTFNTPKIIQSALILSFILYLIKYSLQQHKIYFCYVLITCLYRPSISTSNETCGATNINIFLICFCQKQFFFSENYANFMLHLLVSQFYHSIKIYWPLI